MPSLISSPLVHSTVVKFNRKAQPMNTSVVFRVDRDGDTFALFPELPADNQGIYCTAYQHVGQHCAADYQLCMARSRPARAAEYADLFTELEQRGYNLVVHQRATHVMHERRRFQAFNRFRVQGCR